jgi:hypothetical protein
MNGGARVCASGGHVTVTPRSILAALGVSTLTLGCTALLGDATEGMIDPPSVGSCNTGFSCGATSRLETLPRLSREQYAASIRAVLTDALPSDVDDIWTEVEPSVARVPEEPTKRSSLFRSMDQSVSAVHVATQLEVASAVATAITRDEARLGRLLACGSADGNACVDAWIRRFGRLVYRHTLSAAEFDFLREVYQGDGIDLECARDVLTVMFDCPQFLYRLEYGVTRLATIRIEGHFTSFAGDWHNEVAHLAAGPTKNLQDLLIQSYQRTYEYVMLNLARKLDQPELDGSTYLDNSLLAWSIESGTETHSPVGMPLVTMGSASCAAWSRPPG